MCSSKHKKSVMMLCPVSFGVAWGLAFALMMLAFAWVAYFFGYGMAAVEYVSSFYYGYEASLMGGLMGALWGFIEGFVLGFLIGLFYDGIICCCKKYCCQSSCQDAKCCDKDQACCSKKTEGE